MATICYFQLIDIDNIRKTLPSDSGIAVVNSAAWNQVIQKSHHIHPFGKINEEATQVSVVCILSQQCHILFIISFV